MKTKFSLSRKKYSKFLQSLSDKLTSIKIPAKAVILIIGMLSTVWFLIRVIPKPSRAEYPCMKAAYPLMTSFVVYLIGLGGALAAFKKSQTSFINAKYFVSILLFLTALCFAIIALNSNSIPVYANSKSILAPNLPIGVAKGIYPGRVVWIWNPKSTNENCTNQFGDGWFMDKNTDLNAVTKMVDESIMKLTEKSTLKESWDALFRYFNENNGKGNFGYKDGEKIFIRTNQVSASDNTVDTDYSVKNTSRYGMAETSPQVVLAVLRQLVNECGIKQEAISIGDPMKHMYKHFFEMLYKEFPNVTYLDYRGTLGRTKPASGATPSIQYSDKGTILKSGGTTGTPITNDYFPTVITNADYMIAIPALKAHARAGVTLFGKIHFGSNLRGSASHLHGGLVAPNNTATKPDTLRRGYKSYRIQVDLMGHKDLGGKTVLFLLDGLWAGSEANDPPRKFRMTPFNNDWTSSILVSQDQVALESVGYDFLKTEFTSDNPFGSYPQIPASDSHILQAADSTYWPVNFKYDPENDGIPIKSLGVCEHWNNAIDKMYSRNLKTGKGIELVYLDKSTTSISSNYSEIPAEFKLEQNYPNPFNPATKITYKLVKSGNVSLIVYDVNGNEVEILTNEYLHAGRYENVWNAAKKNNAAAGVYFAKLRTKEFSQTIKMLLLK